jgi:hypothetical protein
VTDKKQFDADKLRAAFGEVGFKEMNVVSGPG